MSKALFTIAVLAFTLWMFIDCVRNEEEKERRMWWSLGLLIFPFSLVVAIAYYFTRHLPRRKVSVPYAREK